MVSDAARWTYTAILLLAGASLVVNPDGLSRIKDVFGLGIRNFERQMRDPLLRRHWRQQWLRPRIVLTNPLPRTGVRFAGVILIALGFIIAVVA